MPKKVLKNKPLIEAILEVKWELQTPKPGVNIDPNYKFLLGRFHERAREKYPAHEQLPTASAPEELVGQMVQHRFRHAAGDWPLLQIGPGIMTLNDTHKYLWDDFSVRAVEAVKILFDAYPKPEELKINNLMLRYIDSVDFDFINEDLFSYLQNMLKVSISMPDNLFHEDLVNRFPSHFNWQAAFPCRKPEGNIELRFATGLREGRPSVIWETIVNSSIAQIPSMPSEFEEWVKAAHDITDDWFFKLIEGDLERRFE